MAKPPYTTFQQTSGAPTYVNADLIRYIYPNKGASTPSTYIHFANDDAILVTGGLDDIARALEWIN